MKQRIGHQEQPSVGMVLDWVVETLADFPTYFHALMEVSLAVAEVTPPPGSTGALGGQAAASAASSSSSIDTGR